jgi:hypothetical protein
MRNRALIGFGLMLGAAMAEAVHAADTPAPRKGPAPSEAIFQSSPFEDRNFDPDRAPVVETVLQPGKPSNFEMFIPYPASSGGLHVRYRMEGRDSGLVKAYVRVGAKDRPVAVHGGQFDVVVPEGETRLLIWLLWDGAPASGDPITLSSTITDEIGTPTHVNRLLKRVRLAQPEK